jgi:hypothetical protein
MQVICIDADFDDFIKMNGYKSFNLPKEGSAYVVRTDNGKGGITLVGLNNPYFAISLQPLMFEELHFSKQRFVVISGAEHKQPFMFSAN